MEGYRNQDACVNCRFVEAISEYDHGDEYVCRVEGSKRPQCGSVYMRETFDFSDDDRAIQQMNAWNTWQVKHRVEAHGICDKYKKEVR